MSEKGHIVHKKNSKTVQQKNRLGKKMLRTLTVQKEVSTKLMKGLLDLIILQFLSTEPMHGYQIITKIRKSFGVYFGPSTIYPLLNTLEKKTFVKSEWNMNYERPRKIYSLTSNGQNMLDLTEESLNLICRKLATQPAIEHPTQPEVTIMAKVPPRKQTV
jgi:DNA-binding PadR family transcriptional regulator